MLLELKISDIRDEVNIFKKVDILIKIKILISKIII